ncbi:HAMP domain-containing protein [Clostridium sp. OM02-18AC]|uniref:cache domain-containing sensor histidine kinase n=1 Tax=Clostridium sp. OM02-18AC TaxID=2292311 RepID=UPI000E556357|nr:histidine kinase [Clostridium sp. OM02-18AC]RHV65129.1 HAMP domain-containing protein [Clostridium sp. OM02-18AC]
MKKIHLSFRGRVFLACLAVALVPLFLSSIVMVRLFTASLNRQSEQEAQRQISEISSRFTALLEDCENVCREQTKDGSVARYMIDTTTVEMQRGMYVSLYQASKEIYGHAQISVYDVGGRLRFTTDTMTRGDRLPVYWGLLKKASGKKQMTWYRTDPYLNLTDSRVLMQGAYPIENSEGARTGYLVLDFTRENFDSIFSGFYSLTDTILLLDAHQRPIYCSRPDYDAEKMEEIAAGMEKQTNTEDDTQYLRANEPERGFSVILCRQAPISAPAMQTMGTVILAMSLLSLCLCLSISGILTRSIARPVSQLDKAMEKVKAGDLSIRVRSTRNDELGRLTESFNRMVIDLNSYLEERVQKQKDLNETTLRLYQTQLNPHFLYNTLDTIKWNARIRQIPEIAVLAENLAVILRKSISSKPFIPLKEELDTIDSYIRIQKIRFSGRFLYETEIPDQLEECMIPKMILQPLVENAIIHGLDGCDNGYICIYAAQKDGVLSISVTDDGCGMSADMVDWINSPAPAKRDGHLGLYNVIQILKIYYGETYGMHAQVEEDGTTVTLRLPFRKDENNG